MNNTALGKTMEILENRDIEPVTTERRRIGLGIHRLLLYSLSNNRN